jgi:hypothetical protein
MDMHLIWVSRERKYFCKRGWTRHFGKHEVICPSGKVFAGCVDGGGWVLSERTFAKTPANPLAHRARRDGGVQTLAVDG